MCYKRQLPVLNANRNGIFYYIFIYQLLLYIYCQFFSWFKRNLCNLGISHWQPSLVFVGLLHSVKICCVFIKKQYDDPWPLRDKKNVYEYSHTEYMYLALYVHTRSRDQTTVQNKISEQMPRHHCFCSWGRGHSSRIFCCEIWD